MEENCECETFDFTNLQEKYDLGAANRNALIPRLLKTGQRPKMVNMMLVLEMYRCGIPTTIQG